MLYRCLVKVLYTVNSIVTATFKVVQMKFKQAILNLIKMIIIKRKIRYNEPYKLILCFFIFTSRINVDQSWCRPENFFWLYSDWGLYSPVTILRTIVCVMRLPQSLLLTSFRMAPVQVLAVSMKIWSKYALFTLIGTLTMILTFKSQ